MNHTHHTLKPLVALTFDDGPNTTTTVEILNLLETYGVCASFFLVGNNITPDTKAVMQRAHQMGCELANHSQNHLDMTKLSPAKIQSEILPVSRQIQSITGYSPAFFRPPYIAVNDTMLKTINMTFICGVGCNDWDVKVTEKERITNTLKQVEDGTIILLHDSEGNSQTVAALKTLIPALQNQGYQFVTVSDLFRHRHKEIRPDDTTLYTKVI